MALKVKKDSKGGKRAGAGRKPVEDPKVMVPLYVKSSVLNAFGGLDELRNACYEFLNLKINHIKTK